MTKLQGALCGTTCLCVAGALTYLYFATLENQFHLSNEDIIQAVLCYLLPAIACAGAGIMVLAGNKNREQ
ncbi:hypothetical protein KDK77_01820 [bacterium]|nr:hypothetical protein [bacterium]